MTSKTSRYLFVCICAYVSIITALTLLNRLGPDQWWFSALNLYLPQVFWLIPGVILTAICLVMARRWIWAPLLCIAWIAGPIMGFCWAQHGSHQASVAAPIRIMTWNVKYGQHGTLALTYDIDKNRPDIILLQDATGLLDGPLGGYFQKWNTYADGQFVIASRFPLSNVEVRSISLPWEELTCLRCRIRVGATTITMYNVHLESPRQGLNAIRSARKDLWYLPNAIQQLEGNVFTRLMQARILREFILREKGPVIVAGDLNSPDTSLVCASLRDAGLHDAFAEGGRGYGYTYGHFLLQRKFPWMRASWMRIDHIMMSSQLETQRSWTGTGEASDHRPVIADFILKQL
jgi:vancomycin resistance protein VanJ